MSKYFLKKYQNKIIFSKRSGTYIAESIKEYLFVKEFLKDKEIQILNNNTVYCIYDMQNKEQCVAQFDSLLEVSRWCGQTVNNIASAISKSNKINRRFEIHRVELV